MHKSDDAEEVSATKVDEDKILQDWYKKRRLNVVVTYFYMFMFIFEYSSIVISALFYFKDTLKVNNPKLYYSLALGAASFCTPISSIVVGKYTDKTRDVRRVALFLSLFNIVGNLCYVFPLVNWLPIVGRMFCGFPDGVKSAFTGKLILSIERHLCGNNFMV